MGGEFLNFIKEFGLILVLAILSLGVFYGIKVKVLGKYYIKKMYLIIAMVIVLVSPILVLVITKTSKVPQWISLIEMLLFTVIFLIYMEILKIDKINKNKPVIGKPKPNPNRVKNQK